MGEEQILAAIGNLDSRVTRIEQYLPALATGEELRLQPGLLNQGKSLLGTWGGDSIPDRDFPRIAELMVTKKIDVAPLLTKRYALAEINAALGDLKDGRVGRPVIDMSL